MATKKYGKGAAKVVEKEIQAYKKGTAGSGPKRKKVTSRKQAIAIGLAKARKKGIKVPQKSTTTKKSTATKRASSKK